MEEINTFIEILQNAGIRYEVDQSMANDGRRSLDVYIYDDNDGLAIFTFNTDISNLVDFRIMSI